MADKKRSRNFRSTGQTPPVAAAPQAAPESQVGPLESLVAAGAATTPKSVKNKSRSSAPTSDDHSYLANMSGVGEGISLRTLRERLDDNFLSLASEYGHAIDKAFKNPTRNVKNFKDHLDHARKRSISILVDSIVGDDSSRVLEGLDKEFKKKLKSAYGDKRGKRIIREQFESSLASHRSDSKKNTDNVVQKTTAQAVVQASKKDTQKSLLFSMVRAGKERNQDAKNIYQAVESAGSIFPDRQGKTNTFAIGLGNLKKEEMEELQKEIPGITSLLKETHENLEKQQSDFYEELNKRRMGGKKQSKATVPLNTKMESVRKALLRYDKLEAHGGRGTVGYPRGLFGALGNKNPIWNQDEIKSLKDKKLGDLLESEGAKVKRLKSIMGGGKNKETFDKLEEELRGIIEYRDPKGRNSPYIDAKKEIAQLQLGLLEVDRENFKKQNERQAGSIFQKVKQEKLSDFGSNFLEHKLKKTMELIGSEETSEDQKNLLRDKVESKLKAIIEKGGISLGDVGSKKSVIEAFGDQSLMNEQPDTIKEVGSEAIKQLYSRKLISMGLLQKDPSFFKDDNIIAKLNKVSLEGVPRTREDELNQLLQNLLPGLRDKEKSTSLEKKLSGIGSVAALKELGEESKSIEPISPASNEHNAKLNELKTKIDERNKLVNELLAIDTLDNLNSRLGSIDDKVLSKPLKEDIVKRYNDSLNTALSEKKNKIKQKLEMMFGGNRKLVPGYADPRLDNEIAKISDEEIASKTPEAVSSSILKSMETNFNNALNEFIKKLIDKKVKGIIELGDKHIERLPSGLDPRFRHAKVFSDYYNKDNTQINTSAFQRNIKPIIDASKGLGFDEGGIKELHADLFEQRKKYLTQQIQKGENLIKRIDKSLSKKDDGSYLAKDISQARRFDMALQKRKARVDTAKRSGSREDVSYGLVTEKQQQVLDDLSTKLSNIRIVAPKSSKQELTKFEKMQLALGKHQTQVRPRFGDQPAEIPFEADLGEIKKGSIKSKLKALRERLTDYIPDPLAEEKDVEGPDKIKKLKSIASLSNNKIFTSIDQGQLGDDSNVTKRVYYGLKSAFDKTRDYLSSKGIEVGSGLPPQNPPAGTPPLPPPPPPPPAPPPAGGGGFDNSCCERIVAAINDSSNKICQAIEAMSNRLCNSLDNFSKVVGDKSTNDLAKQSESILKGLDDKFNPFINAIGVLSKSIDKLDKNVKVRAELAGKMTYTKFSAFEGEQRVGAQKTTFKSDITLMRENIEERLLGGNVGRLPTDKLANRGASKVRAITILEERALGPMIDEYTALNKQLKDIDNLDVTQLKQLRSQVSRFNETKIGKFQKFITSTAPYFQNVEQLLGVIPKLDASGLTKKLNQGKQAILKEKQDSVDSAISEGIGNKDAILQHINDNINTKDERVVADIKSSIDESRKRLKEALGLSNRLYNYGDAGQSGNRQLIDVLMSELDDAERKIPVIEKPKKILSDKDKFSISEAGKKLDEFKSLDNRLTSIDTNDLEFGTSAFDDYKNIVVSRNKLIGDLRDRGFSLSKYLGDEYGIEKHQTDLISSLKEERSPTTLNFSGAINKENNKLQGLLNSRQAVGELLRDLIEKDEITDDEKISIADLKKEFNQLSSDSIGIYKNLGEMGVSGVVDNIRNIKRDMKLVSRATVPGLKVEKKQVPQSAIDFVNIFNERKSSYTSLQEEIEKFENGTTPFNEENHKKYLHNIKLLNKTRSFLASNAPKLEKYTGDKYVGNQAITDAIRGFKGLDLPMVDKEVDNTRFIKDRIGKVQEIGRQFVTDKNNMIQALKSDLDERDMEDFNKLKDSFRDSGSSLLSLKRQLESVGDYRASEVIDNLISKGRPILKQKPKRKKEESPLSEVAKKKIENFNETVKSIKELDKNIEEQEKNIGNLTTEQLKGYHGNIAKFNELKRIAFKQFSGIEKYKGHSKFGTLSNLEFMVDPQNNLMDQKNRVAKTREGEALPDGLDALLTDQLESNRKLAVERMKELQPIPRIAFSKEAQSKIRQIKASGTLSEKQRALIDGYEEEMNKLSDLSVVTNHHIGDINKQVTALTNLSTAASVVKQAASEISRYALYAGGAIAGMVALGLRNMSSFEYGLAHVERISEQSTSNIESHFLRMSEAIGMSATRLAKVAQLSAQMGLSGKGLEKFTETAAKLSLVSDMDVAEGAEGLSRMMFAFGQTREEVIKNADAMGSSLIQLAKASNTTAAQMLNMMSRIGSSAHILGLTEHEALAVTTALLHLGSSPEQASTGISIIFREMANNMDEFAQLAGINKKVFSEMFEKTPYEAFKAFLRGYKNLGKKSKQESLALAKTLLVSRSGTKITLDKLAASLDSKEFSIDVFKKMSEEASKDGQELNYSLDTLTKTVQFRAAQLKESMSVVFTEAFAPLSAPLQGLLVGLTSIFNLFEAIPWPIKTATVALMGFTAAVFLLISAVTFLVSLVGTMVMVFTSAVVSILSFARQSGGILAALGIADDSPLADQLKPLRNAIEGIGASLRNTLGIFPALFKEDWKVGKEGRWAAFEKAKNTLMASLGFGPKSQTGEEARAANKKLRHTTNTLLKNVGGEIGLGVGAVHKAAQGKAEGALGYLQRKFTRGPLLRPIGESPTLRAPGRFLDRASRWVVEGGAPGGFLDRVSRWVVEGRASETIDPKKVKRERLRRERFTKMADNVQSRGKSTLGQRMLAANVKTKMRAGGGGSGLLGFFARPQIAAMGLIEKTKSLGFHLGSMLGVVDKNGVAANMFSFKGLQQFFAMSPIAKLVAIGLAILMIGRMIKSANPAIKNMGIVLAGVLLTIGILTGMWIPALIGAGGFAVGFFDEFTIIVKKFGAAFMSVFEGPMQFVSKVFAEIGSNRGGLDLLERLTGAAEVLGFALGQILTPILYILGAAIALVGEFVMDFYGTLYDILAPTVKMIGGAIQKFMDLFKDGDTSGISSIYGALKQVVVIIAKLAAIFIGFFGVIFGKILQYSIEQMTAFVGFFVNAYKKVSSAISGWMAGDSVLASLARGLRDAALELRGFLDAADRVGGLKKVLDWILWGFALLITIVTSALLIKGLIFIGALILAITWPMLKVALIVLAIAAAGYWVYSVFLWIWDAIDSVTNGFWEMAGYIAFLISPIGWLVSAFMGIVHVAKLIWYWIYGSSMFRIAESGVIIYDALMTLFVAPFMILKEIIILARDSFILLVMVLLYSAVTMIKTFGKVGIEVYNAIISPFLAALKTSEVIASIIGDTIAKLGENTKDVTIELIKSVAQILTTFISVPEKIFKSIVSVVDILAKSMEKSLELPFKTIDKSINLAATIMGVDPNDLATNKPKTESNSVMDYIKDTLGLADDAAEVNSSQQTELNTDPIKELMEKITGNQRINVTITLENGEVLASKIIDVLEERRRLAP